MHIPLGDFHNWKNSGFSVDHSIRIPAFSIRSREALFQYIARPPLSLKKISTKEDGVGTVVSFVSAPADHSVPAAVLNPRKNCISRLKQPAESPAGAVITGIALRSRGWA